MQSADGLGNTFGRSWELLTKNWILIVPGIVIGVIAALVVFMLVSLGLITGAGMSSVGFGGAGLGALALAGLAVALVGLIAFILTIAYTTGMAAAAWRTGTATLADGSAAFRADGSALLTAIVLLILIGIVAAFLLPFTLGISMLLFWIFFLYTFASVVVGRKSGSEAISDSFRVATRNFGTTLLVVILLAIAFLCAAWVERVLHNIPLIGPVANYVIQQIVAAYATLVIVGEYIKLGARVRTPGTPSGGPPATY